MEVRVKPKGKKNTSPIQQFDRISKGSNRVLSTVMGLITLLSVIPFILVCIISVSDSDSITKYGYSLIPRKFSWSAYQYVFSDGGILKAFGTSVFITVMGTVIGLLLMSTYAYALSRKSFAYQKILARIALFPMLFGGGMIGNYLVVVNILKLRNSVWALILPMAMSTFSIMVLRTFYRMTIPDSLIESAYIDGASEWKIYFKIILPLSLPGLATIALFLSLGYWNDWLSALLYTENNQIVPLQYMLMKMETNLEYLNQNIGQMGVGTNTSGLPTETLKMAVVVVSTLPILIAYPFFQKYFVGGLTLGAIKE